MKSPRLGNRWMWQEQKQDKNDFHDDSDTINRAYRAGSFGQKGKLNLDMVIFQELKEYPSAKVQSVQHRGWAADKDLKVIVAQAVGSSWRH